jgi:D-xylose transport system ATP-binding protein
MNQLRNDSPLLEMRSISKSFPGVRALDQVSFDVLPGEIHSLTGENGAGKSTLIKIVAGVYPYGSYEGDLVVGGEIRRFPNVHAAEKAGIAVVHQELSLVPEFSIAENIFLGREPRRFGIIRKDELLERARTALDGLGLKLEPARLTGALGIGQQHLVEIAKALTRDARILVLDEPTAALTNSEADVLFRILNDLRTRNVGIVYISHKLDEVFRLSDRITVLRDGKSVSTDAAAAVDTGIVISRMVGREVSQLFPVPHNQPGDVVFEAQGVTVEDPNVAGKLLVDDVSFDVRRGEVLGIAGLVGSGRTDLLMALFGAHPGRVSAAIRVDGRPVVIDRPSQAIAAGIGFVTEDRKRFGLLLEQSIVSNLTIAALERLSGSIITDLDAETTVAMTSVKDMRIKAHSVFTIAGTLSGGNQQKIVLAKWLLTNPQVLLLDEPTRGIDIGAKEEIYLQINRLAGEGLAIVLVSSDLTEVLHLSDRLLVLHEGRVSGELARGADAATVIAFATGQRTVAGVAKGE